MLSIITQQGSANQNDNEAPPSTQQTATIKGKKAQKSNVDRDVEKVEPWYTAGKNVKWGSPYGKQYEASSKT